MIEAIGVSGMPDVHPPEHPARVATGQAAPTISKDFDAMMLRPLLDAMLPRSEAVHGGGAGGETWRSMLVDALARDWAERGAFAIAERMVPDVAAGVDGTPRPGGSS